MSKGAKLSGGDFDEGVELDLRLDYLELPLLLVLPLRLESGASPYFFGGPTFAFETACELSAEGPGIEITFDCDEGEDFDIEVLRKTTDIGIALGAGVDVPAGPGSFLVEGRYTLGLTNIDDSEDDDAIKNRSAAVMIGYSFPIGG